MLNIFSRKFLYFPGCFTNSITPEIVANYQRIMNNLKINYAMSDEIGCCGAVALSNGYTKDFESLIEKNSAVLSDMGIKNIITNSGDCMKTFALNYKVNVHHISQVLVKYIDKLPVKYEEEISIYDSPSLEVFEEPRAILESLGFDVIELKSNRDNTVLCGYEGGMIQNVPHIADKMAKLVFDMVKTKKLVVIDPLAYYHLKNNAPRDIQVLELSEVVV